MRNDCGVHNGETVYCPVNDWECPYWKKGVCTIEDAVEDCADFGAHFPTWEDWENT